MYVTLCDFKYEIMLFGNKSYSDLVQIHLVNYQTLYFQNCTIPKKLNLYGPKTEYDFIVRLINFLSKNLSEDTFMLDIITSILYL